MAETFKFVQQIYYVPLMTIAICASMRFLKEMGEVEARLREMGFEVEVPEGLLMVKRGWKIPKTPGARVKNKIKYNFIKKHFAKIKKSQAILVLNYDKDGQANYIGPNSFLEMGFAFWLGKKIFVLNPLPRSFLWEEVRAMQPVVLNGDLGKIK